MIIFRWMIQLPPLNAFTVSASNVSVEWRIWTIASSSHVYINIPHIRIQPRLCILSFMNTQMQYATRNVKKIRCIYLYMSHSEWYVETYTKKNSIHKLCDSIVLNCQTHNSNQTDQNDINIEKKNPAKFSKFTHFWWKINSKRRTKWKKIFLNTVFPFEHIRRLSSIHPQTIVRTTHC